MGVPQREALPRCRIAPAAAVALCAALLLGLGCLLHADADPVSTAASASAAGHHPLRVGSMELRPCLGVPAYCGDLNRPLDPTGAIPRQISIHFEYYPHSGPEQPLETLVATEGGPGYPATLSRDEYLDLFAPLRRRHDVLLMDNRGTGQSAAIDCHELQTAEQWTVELIAACGRTLGPSAALYGSAYAADDLAAILEALGIRRIDLYGDSYGTYFEQVFALRHPDTLRAIVLDGAYPLNGPDYAWYPTYAPAMRDKFDIACRRSAPCARQPGTSIDHMLPALRELRAHPFAARAADSDGKEREFSADAPRLAIVMFGSAPALATARELDAAARAFSGGDRVPLLRLMSETISGVDSRDPTADSTKWSAGLAAAVMCHDPPQIFDMRLTPALRIADRDRAIARRKATLPETYAPFSIDEYRGMPLDYGFIDQCVEWPVAPPAHPASQVGAPDSKYPDIPALIVSGELDNITTPADGAAAAHAFRHGRQILIANSFHVNALPHARSACGARIVRHFIETLDLGDTSCAADVPPLRLVPQFALHAADVDPAAAAAGNRAGAAQLRWAQAAVQTAGDVLARLGGNSTGAGVGLRGGRFRIVNGLAAIHISLDQVRWTEDLAVSGQIDKPAARTGTVHATLHLAGPQGAAGDLTVEWPEGVAAAVASIRGRLGGVIVRANSPAP